MSESQQPDPATSKRKFLRKRTGVLLLFGVAVVSLAAAWRHFVYARPIGSGPAGPAVSRKAFESEWSQRPVVLLGLGDSVTQGLGASAGNSYFNRLLANPSDEFDEMREINLTRVLPRLESANLSVSGMTSIECVDHQLPKLKPWPGKESFGLVVLTVGGNDVVHNYGRTPPREGAMYGAKKSDIAEWKKNFGDRLEKIAGKVRKIFPGGSHIFIADIYDPTDGDSDTQFAGLPRWPDGSAVLNEWNSVVRKFAQRHDDVTLVEMRAAFLGHGIHCTQFWHHSYRSEDPYYWYWDNLEDPNDRGYDAIRRLFLNEIARVLPGRLTD
jgi:lysophospholipase L1-like esterase